MDLAVRLWLMLNILDDRQNIHLDQSLALQWNEDATLQGFVSQLFPRAHSPQTHVLDHDFIAVNISRLSGIEIKWCYSLHEHLSIERRKTHRILKVYPFKQWLLLQLGWITQISASDPSFR